MGCDRRDHSRVAPETVFDMMRIVIECLFVFLVPSLLYLVWVAYEARDWPGLGSVVSRAPLLKLFVAGATLMLVTLLFLSSRTRNSPNEAYVPPSFKNGHLEPGHTAPLPQLSP